MENQQLVSPSRQCSSTSVSFGQGFLAKNNVTTLEYLQYMVPADFYLFPRLKAALKGRRLCDSSDIITNATEELKKLSQNGFQECFQHVYSRWQKCIFERGDYLEGNVA